MKRKCDLCDREATVHDLTIKNGRQVEKHLCEQCAKDEGVAVQQHAPINELITKFVLSHAGVTDAAKPVGACPSCGMTFADFKSTAQLGCAACYVAFEAQLSPVLERSHEGATHHVGKSPGRREGAGERLERIRLLRKQLSDAVAAEQYERAAALRDELTSAEDRRGVPGSGPALRTGSAASAADDARAETSAPSPNPAPSPAPGSTPGPKSTPGPAPRRKDRRSEGEQK